MVQVAVLDTQDLEQEDQVIHLQQVHLKEMMVEMHKDLLQEMVEVEVELVLLVVMDLPLQQVMEVQEQQMILQEVQ